MPALANHKHELFAQGLAQGRSQVEAYEIAGYKPHDGNAAKLASKQEIEDRVAEIIGAAAEKTGVTAERVIAELAKIGFADIRKAVDWTGTLVEEQDNSDGGEVLVVKHIHNNHVRLISAKDLDDETAAAIAEIRQNVQGGVTIKFHDKQAALLNLGRHLGLFKDKVELSGTFGLGDRLDKAIGRK